MKLLIHPQTSTWDEPTHPFPNSNGCTVEVWEWISNFISHFIMDVITYRCWDDSLSKLVKGTRPKWVNEIKGSLAEGCSWLTYTAGHHSIVTWLIAYNSRPRAANVSTKCTKLLYCVNDLIKVLFDVLWPIYKNRSYPIVCLNFD